MDFIRTMYKTEMRFDPGSSTSYQVEWYPAPVGALAFEGPTPFRSRVWSPNTPATGGLGEVIGASRFYSKGVPPCDSDGLKPKGDLDWFRNGFTYNTANLFDGCAVCGCSLLTCSDHCVPNYLFAEVGNPGSCPEVDGLDARMFHQPGTPIWLGVYALPSGGFLWLWFGCWVNDLILKWAYSGSGSTVPSVWSVNMPLTDEDEAPDYYAQFQVPQTGAPFCVGGPDLFIYMREG